MGKVKKEKRILKMDRSRRLTVRLLVGVLEEIIKTGMTPSEDFKYEINGTLTMLRGVEDHSIKRLEPYSDKPISRAYYKTAKAAAANLKSAQRAFEANDFISALNHLKEI